MEPPSTRKASVSNIQPANSSIQSRSTGEPHSRNSVAIAPNAYPKKTNPSAGRLCREEKCARVTTFTVRQENRASNRPLVLRKPRRNTIAPSTRRAGVIITKMCSLQRRNRAVVGKSFTKPVRDAWKKILTMTVPFVLEVRGDQRSVKSSGGPANAQGQFDMNGCCVLHSHVQVAKKKLVGGWKVLRTCPACNGEEVGLDDDAISVSSKNSRKSTRSTRSAKSTKSGKAKKGQATKSGRYGNLPFDGDGYCCRHPSVQIATKKLLGGWKIIHDVCPDCAEEMGVKTSRKPSRRKSGRVIDPNGSDTSSIKSGKSASSKGRKKTKKVKNFRTEDENGYAGDYTGEVNAEYKPHGNGVMRYFDGNTFEGVWHEGSQVHGKARRRKSKF
ncbi:hypothetical protein ACHAXS_005165 [Conticribra weissflogii]